MAVASEVGAGYYKHVLSDAGRPLIYASTWAMIFVNAPIEPADASYNTSWIRVKVLYDVSSSKHY